MALVKNGTGNVKRKGWGRILASFCQTVKSRRGDVAGRLPSAPDLRTLLQRGSNIGRIRTVGSTRELVEALERAGEARTMRSCLTIVDLQPRLPQ
jgi:hypothetical protein